MWVAWTIAPGVDDAETSHVQIRHVFRPVWPVPDRVIRGVVGEYFVNGVARRTLARLAELAQGPT